MPTYNSSIALTGDKHLPGDVLEGKVIYTASNDCTLIDAKLQLECRAYYCHQGNRKHKHAIHHSPVSIPFFLRDEGNDIQQTIQHEERLNGLNKPTVFKFKTTLPKDLLPTTREGEGKRRGGVLDVSYTLVLSSKRGFLSRSRKKDASITLTVLDTLDVNGEPFIPNQVADRAVSVTDARLGQRMDMLTTAIVPRLGWERGETLTLKLHVVKMSTVNTHTAIAVLERTVGYRDMQTITDVVVSRAVHLNEHEAPFSIEMPLTIPGDTPHSGVMSCPTLSVHYRVRVEIKTACHNLPIFTMGLPINVGHRPQRLVPESSGLDDGSRSDRARPAAEPCHLKSVVRRTQTVCRSHDRPPIINQTPGRGLSRAISDNAGTSSTATPRKTRPIVDQKPQPLPSCKGLQRASSAVGQSHLDVVNPSSGTSEASSYSAPTRQLRPLQQSPETEAMNRALMASRHSRAQWAARAPGRHLPVVHGTYVVLPPQNLSSISEETHRKLVILSDQHSH